MRYPASMIIFASLTMFMVPIFASATGEFSVSPAHRELFVAPGGSKTFSVALTNSIGREAEFTLSSEDFAPDSVSGEASLLGSQKSTHSLKDFIKSPVRTVTVKDGETVNIPITIDIPSNLQDPSIYGAVVIGVDNGKESVTTGARLSSRIGVGVFVRTVEKLDPRGHLAKFDTATGKRMFFQGPVLALISYANEGNIYLSPSGTITLSNMFGKLSQVETVSPWYVLPDSVRSKSLGLNSKYSIGRYTALLRINNGLNGKLEEASVSYWVISWRVCLIILGLGFALLMLRRSMKNLIPNSSAI